jgi:hypothetical protein
MAWVQRFYDVDITTFANTTYDAVDEHTGLSDDYDRIRLYKMIHDNQDLIKNAKDIYLKLQPALESARWTLGKNLYKFFVSQLELIP